MTTSFDPMAKAIEWLDAYRARALDALLDLYDGDASIECGCDRRTTVAGLRAIAAYWQQRFRDHPAQELVDVQRHGDGVAVFYQVPDGVVRAVLTFNAAGKIQRTACGPTREIRSPALVP